MKTFATGTAIALLTLFSLAVSVQVWSELSPSSSEKVFLVLAAVGIELTKLVLIPASYALWKACDDRRIPVTCLAVVMVLISVATMTNYFDQKLMLHAKIEQKTNAETARSRAIDSAKLGVIEGYQKYGKITKSLEVLQDFETGETAATPVTTTVSPLLLDLAATPGKRYIALVAIAATIDLAIAVLLLLMVSGGQHRQRDIVPPPKQENALSTAPVIDNKINAIEASIAAIPSGQVIPIRQLVESCGARHAQIQAVVNRLIEEGEVIKEGARYKKVSTRKQLRSV